MQQIESLKFRNVSGTTGIIRICFQPKSETIDYLAQVRDNLAHFEFRSGTWMMPYCTYRKGGSCASLTKAKFLLYFRNHSGVSFSLLGYDFLCSLYYFSSKNLTDTWAQLPNSGPVLNNWLMSGTLAVTGVTV